MKMKGKIMANLLRVSKVNETPGFPLRSSTLYKWIHTKKHLEIFCKVGGAVFVDLSKFDQLVAKGSMARKGA
jgi:hypothetical protein